MELSPLGLRSYGGNYAFYAQAKAQEQQSAMADLDRAKHDRRRAAQAMRDQRERQEKRQTRAAKGAKQANQAKILLDRQKERSDQSMGKLHRQPADAQAALSQRVRDAAAQVADIGLRLVEVHISNPYAREAFRHLSVVGPVATGTIAGFGFESYHLALQALAG